MRVLAVVIFGTAIIVSAEPTWAQTYDPNYPVCMIVSSGDDSHTDCSFTSMEQCKNGSAVTGHCFDNPLYKAPPPELAPVAETPPAPAAKTNQVGTGGAIAVRLPQPLRAALDKYAAQHKKTRSDAIVEILAAALTGKN